MNNYRIEYLSEFSKLVIHHSIVQAKFVERSKLYSKKKRKTEKKGEQTRPWNVESKLNTVVDNLANSKLLTRGGVARKADPKIELSQLTRLARLTTNVTFLTCPATVLRLQDSCEAMLLQGDIFAIYGRVKIDHSFILSVGTIKYSLLLL